MKHMIHILIFIIICILYYQYYKWGNDIEIFTFDTHVPGPNILIVSGTHGNEPAGRIVIEEFLKNDYFKQFKKGKIYVIPRTNKSGSMVGMRYMLHNLLFPDLNRNYNDDGKEPISQRIINLIKEKQIDFILDFHEGWGFHTQNKKSIGSTLSATTPLSMSLAQNIINTLNSDIPVNKKFVLNGQKDHLFTLRNYAKKKQIHYLLVETTGQNRIQPIDIRKKQVTYILNYILHTFNI